MPISELRFPKVSVCPPANTFTNLNYDLMMAENMTLDNDTKKELIKTILQTLDFEMYKELRTNMSYILEENRFYNWYHGYSKISFPKYENRFFYKLEIASSTGLIMTNGFGNDFKKQKFIRVQEVEIIFDGPNQTKLSKNATIMIKMEAEKFLNLFDGYEFITLDYVDVLKGKKEVSFNLSLASTLPRFKLKHRYSLSDSYLRKLKMEKMPGFRISWKYSEDFIPRRTYFSSDATQQSNTFHNNAFNRFY